MHGKTCEDYSKISGSNETKYEHGEHEQRARNL